MLTVEERAKLTASLMAEIVRFAGVLPIVAFGPHVEPSRDPATYEMIPNSESVRGVTLEFANGNVLSVQWRGGNYSNLGRDNIKPGEAITVEIAAWDNAGTWFRLSPYDDVEGYVTIEHVAHVARCIANPDSSFWQEVCHDKSEDC